jgi:hypothetical protein
LDSIHTEERLATVMNAYANMWGRYPDALFRAANLWDFLCAGGLDPKDGSSASVICQWITSSLDNTFTKTVNEPPIYNQVMKNLGDWYTGQSPAERNQMLQHATDWRRTQPTSKAS